MIFCKVPLYQPAMAMANGGYEPVPGLAGFPLFFFGEKELAGKNFKGDSGPWPLFETKNGNWCSIPGKGLKRGLAKKII